MADPSAGRADLPADVLVGILDRLELPEILAVAAVCPSWRFAVAMVGNVPPPRRTPWLVFWGRSDCNPNISEFHNLCNGKIYHISLPESSRGRSLHCCGSSHGWLIVSDDRSNLLIYNPFTRAEIPLPPVAELHEVEPIFDSEGRIINHGIQGLESRLREFYYQKVVFSCDPSRGDYIAMFIHGDRYLSFARAGGHWQQLLSASSGYPYADCIHHDGRFYTLTARGALEVWDLDGEVPKSELIMDAVKYSDSSMIGKYLVSTPWGDLLQVWIMMIRRRSLRVKIVKIYKVDLAKWKLVRMRSRTALREHVVFVGQNHSVCLPGKDFPHLRQYIVCFNDDGFSVYDYRGQSKGARIYDLKDRTTEHIVPFDSGRFNADRMQNPFPVWITPSLI